MTKIRDYTIFKGFHYSTFIPSILKARKDTIVFEKKLAFDQSCRYEIDEPSCVNKLFGFCFGLFGVHKNSFRFGWTYDKDTDTYSIWNYRYYNGKLTKYVIKSFSAKGIPLYDFKIVVNHIEPSSGIYKHVYNVTPYIDGVPMYPCRFESDKCLLLTLGPYFGGHSRAPHTMTIKELKDK